MSMQWIAGPDDKTFWQSMGKTYRITAIFTDDSTANSHMAQHLEQGLIAELGEFRVVAELKPYVAGRGR